MSKLSSKKWHQQKRWILGSLLLCPPLGISLLWLSPWSKAGKISGSVLSGFLLLVALVGATADPEPTSAQISPVETAQTVATEQKPKALAAPPSAYEDALSDATAASEALPTAETSADWVRIAAQWQRAIASLNDIPTNSDYSTQAQTKIAEYERSYEYAIAQKTAIETAEEQQAVSQEAETVMPIVEPQGGGYVGGTCKDLKASGVGSNFTPGDANYTSARDRDGDGVACES